MNCVSNNIRIGVLIFLIVNISSCRKFVAIDPPPQRITVENVYGNEQTAIAVLTGLYSRISNPGVFTGNTSISMFCGLSADELTLYEGVSDPVFLAYYTNSLTGNVNSSFGSEFWSPLFNYIFTCNAAIEGLTSSTALSSHVKEQLLGEAKFMRAFLYFYLVNHFGDVPLVLSTDYKVNTALPRASSSIVYQQIVSDLNDAKSLLSSEFLDGALQVYPGSGDVERVRPTKWVASALLARVYLYTGDYRNAESESTILIDKSDLFHLESLNNVFLKNSFEAIWQLQPVKGSRNTEDAMCFILSETGPTSSTARPVYLSDQLLASFEPDDQRKQIGNWINNVIVLGDTFHFPFKYKNNGASVTEYLMIFRLAEQYLIRSEARAQQNKFDGAQNDLNMIRTRAGLLNNTSNEKELLLSSILHERKTELFTELGHRWLDLKRTANINAIMTVITPIKSNGAVNWQPYQQLFPLPFSDVQKSPNIAQNIGY